MTGVRVTGARVAGAGARRPRAWPRAAVTAGAAAWVLGLLCCLTVAAAGPAAAAPKPPGGVAAAAQALRSSPLYVDPDMTWIFSSASEKQIETALRKSPVRVFVAAVPYDIDDDFSDYASYYLQQLYQAVQQHGVYLAVGPSGDIYDAEYYVPRDINLPFSVEEEQYTLISPAQIAGNTASRILRLVALVGTSPVDAGAAGPAQPMYTPGEFASTGAGTGAASGGSDDIAPAVTAGILSFLLLGPLLVLAGYGLVRRGRGIAANGRGWGDDGDPGSPAGRMPAWPSTDWLLRHARGELAALEKMISVNNANSAGNPGWPRACDCYDAGMLALNSKPQQIDLVGAIVLARDGRLALDWRTAQPSAPCLVNPLHGRSTAAISASSIPLQQLVQQLKLGQVPACGRCARSSRRAGRANLGPLNARLLQVEHDGRRVFYFTFDSIWRDTMFGASGPSLPQAVREHLGVS